MKTLDWIKEFWEEIYKIKRELCLDGKDSPIHKFGYKTRRGDELFMVVDFGNIESFIKQTLLSQYKERMERIKGMKRKPEIETGEDLVGLTFMTIDNRNYNQALDDVIKSEQSLYGGEEL